MKPKFWRLVAAAVVLSGAATFGADQQVQQNRARAWPNPGTAPQFGFPPPLELWAALNLTGEQREQIRAIVQEQQNLTAAQRVMGIERQLRVAIFSDTPDPSAIDQLSASLVDARAAAEAARIQTLLRIAQVLTPEQRASLRESPMFGPRPRPR